MLRDTKLFKAVGSSSPSRVSLLPEKENPIFSFSAEKKKKKRKKKIPINKNHERKTSM